MGSQNRIQCVGLQHAAKIDGSYIRLQNNSSHPSPRWLRLLQIFAIAVSSFNASFRCKPTSIAFTDLSVVARTADLRPYGIGSRLVFQQPPIDNIVHVLSKFCQVVMTIQQIRLHALHMEAFAAII